MSVNHVFFYSKCFKFEHDFKCNNSVSMDLTVDLIEIKIGPDFESSWNKVEQVGSHLKNSYSVSDLPSW